MTDRAIPSRGKVCGRNVMVTIDGVMSVFQSRMRENLNEHGIEEPDPEPDGWYELADFLTVLETVEEDTGRNALKKLGAVTPSIVDWPNGPADGHEALAALPDVYDEYHKGAPGGYEYEPLEDDSARILADTPYPCAFAEGLIVGTVEAFEEGYATTIHPDGRCRDDGGNACAMTVRW